MGTQPSTIQRSNRHDPRLIEAAFETWLTVGGRSYVETAKLLGLPHSTVGFWGKRDDWPARARELDRAAAEAGRNVVSALTVPVAAKALRKLDEILDLEPDHPAFNLSGMVKAIELAAGYAGYVVPKQSLSLTANVGSVDAETSATLRQLDSSELVALAQAIRERRSLPEGTPPPPPPPEPTGRD